MVNLFQKTTNNPVVVNYLSALPGCGKTEVALKDAISNVILGRNVVYIVPSIDLAKEVEQRALSVSNTIYVKRIDSESYNGNVTKNILEFIKKPPPCGCLLIITSEGYARLPYFYKKDEWICYLDEIVQPIQDISLNVSNSVLEGNFRLFDYFEFEETSNPAFNGLYKVNVKKNKKVNVEHMARNKRNDDIWNVISNFCSKVLDPLFTVYVDKKCIDDLYFGWLPDSFTKLHAYTILGKQYLTGFEKCNVLSAFFEFTMFFHYFKDQINFIQNDELQKQLRLPFHHLREILLIYLIEGDANWSKNFYNKTVNDNSIMSLCIEATVKEYEEEDFCYLNNKGLSPIEGGEALPYISHGLNKWDHYNNCAFLGAYNGDIQFIDFCARFSLADILGHDNNILLALQAINRISLRDPNSISPIKIVVATEKMANQIKYFLPNAKIVKSEYAIDVPDELIKKRGQRGKSKNPLDRRLKDMINYNKSTNVFAMNGDICTNDSHKSYDPFFHEKNYNKGLFRENSEGHETSQEDERPLSAISDISSNAEVIELSIFTDKYRNGYNTLDPDNLQDVEDIMEWCSKRELSSKEDNFLISSAMFDRKQVIENKEKLEEWEQNGRAGPKPSLFGKHNIKKMAPLLMLDFDGGNLRPEDLKKIFPDMWIITHSTYSHTNELPKFRAILALSRSCSVEEYEIIAAKTVLMIEDYCENSGIDLGKLAAGSLFYAPGIGRDREAAFFECIHGDRIDVEMMLKSKLGVEQIETPIYKETVVNQEVTEEDQQEVIQEYLERRHVQQLLDALQHKQGGQAGTFNTTICRIAGKISNAPLFVKEYFRIELINRGANANEVMDIWRRYAKYPG